MRFDPRHRTIDLYPPGSQWTSAAPYWIDLNRIDTPTKLLGWIHHLAGKVWFDRTFCRDFIALWSEVTGHAIPIGL